MADAPSRALLRALLATAGEAFDEAAFEAQVIMMRGRAG